MLGSLNLARHVKTPIPTLCQCHVRLLCLSSFLPYVLPSSSPPRIAVAVVVEVSCCVGCESILRVLLSKRANNRNPAKHNIETLGKILEVFLVQSVAAQRLLISPIASVSTYRTETRPYFVLTRLNSLLHPFGFCSSELFVRSSIPNSRCLFPSSFFAITAVKGRLG